MGCQCSNNTLDKYSIENILKPEYESNLNINSKLKLTNYVKKLYYLINNIRTNPSKFADIINSSQKYIREIGDRVIFDKKIKVALNEGKKMFSECEEYLRKISPMEELIFSDDIVIECPTDPNSIKDMDYFKQKVLEKKESQKIEAYFKDSISEPEMSFLLIIVDDSVKNPKKKREAVLNPNFKYIGISSTEDVSESKNQNGIAEKGNNDGNKNIENNNNNNGIIKSPFCAYFSFK